ncbi:hypothetical protein [Paraburkholderia hospita]|uniref:hypothetical protein n=1 Tax=Paraburkholderia hospita TaxID=169430 RepID=UPI001404A8BF|nr:hypothetical protein [Paraburkholderia hospita]
MQTKEARELRDQWGDKPCNHPELTKEYDLSMATGDYVCTTCGKAAWGSDWNRDTKDLG